MGQASSDGSSGPLPEALIIAGPTCSGKSALAMAVAERAGGVVINADSMQVYRELRVLTARPTPADEAGVPHALYGVRGAGSPGSAAWWRGAALGAMADAAAAGRRPILCGGTGLYLAALTGGLADVPEIGVAAREEARALLARDGPAALHARLLMGLGGSLDIFAGDVKRAPKVFIRLNLEWFYRLLCQPSRFVRMLKLPKYLLRAVGRRLFSHKENKQA